MAQFNIIELYRQAFNIIPTVYNIDTKGVTAKGGDYNIQAIGDYTGANESQYGLSLLGTPYFMPTTIRNLRLPNEPIIDLSGAKRIIKTEIDGMEGTFKELFSMDDYRITIRGLCIQEDGSQEYPQEQVRSIIQLCELPQELKVVNTILNMFKIEYLVIESYDFPAMEGAPGVQPYVLSCVSDKPFDLIINSKA